MTAAHRPLKPGTAAAADSPDALPYPLGTSKQQADAFLSRDSPASRSCGDYQAAEPTTMMPGNVSWQATVPTFTLSTVASPSPVPPSGTQPAIRPSRDLRGSARRESRSGLSRRHFPYSLPGSAPSGSVPDGRTGSGISHSRQSIKVGHLTSTFLAAVRGGRGGSSSESESESSVHIGCIHLKDYNHPPLHTFGAGQNMEILALQGSLPACTPEGGLGATTTVV